ncbi:MAG: M15 family metallopeptidase [Alistipes sp.]|nr:M15 family metallopeptidase [Alistipes sp.]
MTDIDRKMRSYGLLNLQELDHTIRADIRYATLDNFTGKILYVDKFGLYAEQRLARAICAANADLSTMKPGHTIVVFDAARPLHIQKQMFDLVKGTPSERYIANPYNEVPGGFHNYGMAVDLSICDPEGNLLDMGTPFDSFSELAHVGDERNMVEKGLLSPDAYANRMFLYSIMGRHGLLPYPFEWWHYQLEQKESDKNRHPILDF